MNPFIYNFFTSVIMTLYFYYLPYSYRSISEILKFYFYLLILVVFRIEILFLHPFIVLPESNIMSRVLSVIVVLTFDSVYVVELHDH